MNAPKFFLSFLFLLLLVGASTAYALPVLTVPQGGTGQTSFDAGECLKGNGTNGIITDVCGSFGQSWQLFTNTFSQSALTPTTTQNIHISGTGTSTFRGGLEAWRQIAAPYFHATSTSATSSFNGNTTASTSVMGYGTLEVVEGGSTYKSVAALRGDDPNRGAALMMERNATTCPLLGCGIWAYRSRGDRTTKTAAQNNDYIFALYTGAHDGTDYEPAASIRTEVDGTVANDQMFGRIVFETNNGGQTLTERVRITSAGRVGVGSTTPGTLFSIGGNGTGWNFVDGTAATTTAQGNLFVKGNIRAGGAVIADVNLMSSGDATINGNLFTIGTASSTALVVSNLTSALHLGGADGTVSEYTGTTCTNQFVRSLNGAGVATCASVSLSADVTGTLPIANGGTNSTSFNTNSVMYFNGTSIVSTSTNPFYVSAINATSTTIASQFLYRVGVASSSPAFPFSVNTALSDFYVTTTGKIVGVDTTNGWDGRITPTRAFVLSAATTTTWTATTSNAYTFASAITVPFAGTLRSVQCTASSTAAFLGIQPLINQTAPTPAYFIASTTRGTIIFSGSNTFAKGDTILMYVGTSTAHVALGVNCMFTATETI